MRHHHLLNNSNIVTGLQHVSLCDQQSHTSPTNWCTNLDLHFVGLNPDLNIISSVFGYWCRCPLYSPEGLLLEPPLPPR